jgi:hypothetical protein
MANKKSDYAAIRVVASPDGIRVWDANRKAIPGIISVDIALRPTSPPLMRVNMICGNFDVAGHPIFAVADPATGQPRPVVKIEFADGGVFEAPPMPELVQAKPNGADTAVPSAPPAEDAPK